MRPPSVLQYCVRQADGDVFTTTEISRKYILSPDPPLITDPRTVQNLTTDAVIQNLAAHSVVNPDIPTQGPRSLLVKHLEELLETREADIQARHLIHIE